MSGLAPPGSPRPDHPTLPAPARSLVMLVRLAATRRSGRSDCRGTCAPRRAADPLGVSTPTPGQGVPGWAPAAGGRRRSSSDVHHPASLPASGQGYEDTVTLGPKHVCRKPALSTAGEDCGSSSQGPARLSPGPPAPSSECAAALSAIAAAREADCVHRPPRHPGSVKVSFP